MQTETEDGVENVSVSLQNANVSVEGATVELENATVEDGTLMVESVNASVDSAEVNAERVVLLRGFELHDFENVQFSVEDEQMSQENVEVDLEEWSELLEELIAGQSGMAVER
jgi:copper chaperone CopZ